MKNIYVVGSSNTDMVVRCDRLPAPGETVLGGEFVSVLGGKGANQAVAAVRLGGRVTFFCRVGNDALGEECISAYQGEGINTSYIIQDSRAKSGVALIVVDAMGENYIAVASGVNANMNPTDIEVLSSLLNPGDVILMQLEIPIETVTRTAAIGREKEAIVILDPAPAPRENLPAPLLQNLDYILPNEHEARALAGQDLPQDELAAALFEMGVKNVIIHAGSQGCYYASAQMRLNLSAHTVQAVDTTAAGDAFAGAFAVALAEDKDILEAIDFAQRAAAISVTRMGAQPSLPRRGEVEGFVG